MVGAVLGIGSLLMRIWSVVRGAKILTFIFVKGLLLSFALFVLPKVIMIALLKFKLYLMPFFLENVETHFGSLSAQNVVLELSDFGAWVAQQMGLVDTLSVLVAGCFTYLSIRMFMSK